MLVVSAPLPPHGCLMLKEAALVEQEMGRARGWVRKLLPESGHQVRP